MPEKKTLERALEDKREGKAPSTQAGEFVREEMEHIREGKHGARSPQQAIAIGLSKARRAGVELPPPRKGTTSEQTREKAERDLEAGRKGAKKAPSPKRSKARRQVLKRESRQAASHDALSKQAKTAAARRRKRGPTTSTRRRSRPAQG
jgi:glutamate synthase domain-containing protein 2